MRIVCDASKMSKDAKRRFEKRVGARLWAPRGGSSWMDQIPRHVVERMEEGFRGQRVQYDGGNASDLVRFARNAWEHYGDRGASEDRASRRQEIASLFLSTVPGSPLPQFFYFVSCFARSL